MIDKGRFASEVERVDLPEVPGVYELGEWYAEVFRKGEVPGGLGDYWWS